MAPFSKENQTKPNLEPRLQGNFLRSRGFQKFVSDYKGRALMAAGFLAFGCREGEATYPPLCEEEYVDCDIDGDGFPEPADCNDGDKSIHPSTANAPVKDIPYNGVDENCDGLDLTDVDGDGYCPDTDSEGNSVPYNAAACPGQPDAATTDCNDEDPSVNPGQSELCDEKDNDCDQAIDDQDLQGVSDGHTWAQDQDGDGYGDASSSVESCEAPSAEYVHVEDPLTAEGDCDDDDDDNYPGAPETCDGDDNDCDDAVDEEPCNPDGPNEEPTPSSTPTITPPIETTSTPPLSPTEIPGSPTDSTPAITPFPTSETPTSAPDEATPTSPGLDLTPEIHTPELPTDVPTPTQDPEPEGTPPPRISITGSYPGTWVLTGDAMNLKVNSTKISFDMVASASNEQEGGLEYKFDAIQDFSSYEASSVITVGFYPPANPEALSDFAAIQFDLNTLIVPQNGDPYVASASECIYEHGLAQVVEIAQENPGYPVFISFGMEVPCTAAQNGDPTQEEFCTTTEAGFDWRNVSSVGLTLEQDQSTTDGDGAFSGTLADLGIAYHVWIESTR